MSSGEDRGSEGSPFERMVTGLLEGRAIPRKVEDFHPEDFQIVIDAIAHLFFNQKSKRGSKLGVEGFADYDGTKAEFSKDVEYPAIRKDRITNYKVVVLPDRGDPEDVKEVRVREALKDFDCLEAVEKYELCLRIFHTFTEPELITLAKQHDPLKRPTQELERRLQERARLRFEGGKAKK